MNEFMADDLAYEVKKARSAPPDYQPNQQSKPMKPRIRWNTLFEQWICFRPGCDDETGFGRTPKIAFADWERLNRNKDPRWQK